MSANSDFADAVDQKDAWRETIGLLQRELKEIEGTILLEFNIPRIGHRIDTVLLSRGVVLVIEFKRDLADSSAINQVWDYALDLKYFHQASHDLPIVPILIATNASKLLPAFTPTPDSDGIYHPCGTDAAGLKQLIASILAKVAGVPIDAAAWGRAPYLPTPTIVEAARSLYARHSVEDIARYDAGATNLRVTSGRVEELAEQTKREKKKAICFVTGVPGAGKTLVGLNVATRNREEDKPTHAVFLSGNGPLVQVLSEALARDEVSRRKARGEKVRKGKVQAAVKCFIQNVHHFRDAGLNDPAPPPEHVVIFDEAQRAWELRKTADFMQRKKSRPGFTMSEPEFLISYMDRHDWALITCLVGGGQEINTGEAGIRAWLEAITAKYPGWDMYISSRLTDSEYAAGELLSQLQGQPRVHFDDALHLAVSMRSFRAENVSAFVKAVLDCEEGRAREIFATLRDRYPVVVSRDLNAAKHWVRTKARGSERYGLVASSKAQRLRPHAIDVRVNVNPVHWFLNEREDVRSSYYLEDAATEFQVQGLELDWACVTWDGDLRKAKSGWSHHDFRGCRWTKVKSPDNQHYLLNAYRVLLTRARQGMAIFVPRGDHEDPTRSPDYYDATYQYLTGLGIPEI